MQTNLGKRVQEMRERAGFTLDDLGAKIGKTHSYIWQIENSLSFSPKVRQVEELADALGTTVEYLLTVEGESEMSARDTAFIRKYETADSRCKTRLRHIFDVLLASERP